MSNFAAGLLTIVLITIGCWIAWGHQMPWRGDWEVKAVVQQANELHTRSPVRIAGVEVGRVKRIERGPANTAVVTMVIDKRGRPLHKDARLKIRPRIFLEGNFFVDLEPGSPSAPLMHDGDTIPLASTSVPVQLDQILAGLQTDTRANLKQLFHGLGDSLADGGAAGLERSFPEWAPAFESVAQVAEASRGRNEGDLAGFVREGGRTAAAVSRDRRALADLVTGLNRTLRALAVHREQLERTLPALDTTLREAGPALAALDDAFPPARELVNSARPALREAPATLRPALPLFRELRGLVQPGELPALERGLDPSLRTLAALEPKLKELFGLVTPVTECLRRNALPTLKTPVDDGDLSTGSPTYRELLYGMPGLASASQNFDGNGPAVRYHAGFGDHSVTLGKLPGTGEALVGFTAEPILGSRPKVPAQKPPFRPDVQCISQDPPNMKAETGPAPEQRPVSTRKVLRR
jgi:virulence factor Mce-like protein